ncbi:MAG: hypothetical protein ACRD1O_06790 [Terriglobia bacterium]
MPAPCRKCGATKTEPVRRNLIYHLLRGFGYRLRKCARCRRRRLVPESAFTRRGGGTRLPSYATTGLGSGRDKPVNQRVDLAAGQPATSGLAAGFDPDGFDGCPRCGGLDFSPTPRHWLERGLGWAPMVRCRDCKRRFTYPQH